MTSDSLNMGIMHFLSFLSFHTCFPAKLHVGGFFHHQHTPLPSMKDFPTALPFHFIVKGSSTSKVLCKDE